MADVVKYGIQIQNRVFVGGVAFDTNEEDLKEFFTQYGKVKECKIIKDNQNISRGFAFVTFECKHDAIQTQQLGTVFFNQKKLNLWPAIRQKGVVFNGAKETDNEPQLSTGVYIHPSGYSYTVAPNGVWYFHNSDGTPPPSMPGSPPMCYAPSVITKTGSRNGSRRASAVSESVSRNVTPPTTIENSLPPNSLPVFHNTPPDDIPHLHQVFQPSVCQPPAGSYMHAHTMGNSNVHVAFQNMSISSHFHSSIPPNQPHVSTPHIIQNIIPNMNVQNISGIAPAGQGQAISYNPEVFYPYYTTNQKMSPQHINPMQPRPMHQTFNEHYAIQIPKTDGCSIIRSDHNMSMKNPSIMYPYINDPYPQQTQFVYPSFDSNKMAGNNHHQQQQFFKNVVAKLPQGFKSEVNHYQENCMSPNNPVPA